MEVREGVEADADALAALADLPVGAVEQLLHERTVRVGVADDAAAEGGADVGSGSTDVAGAPAGPGGRADAGDPASIGGPADTGDPADTGASTDADDLAGFVAFGARPGTVHVTQVAGDEDAVARLLEEPVRFARAEGMAVEVVVPTDAPVCETIESFGFDTVGDGPRFEGAPTRRYRLSAR